MRRSPEPLGTTHPKSLRRKIIVDERHRDSPGEELRPAICSGNGYRGMRPLRTLAILLALVGVLLVLVFVIAPSRTYACSCAPLEPPTESLAKSTSVFAGSVVSIAERGGVDGDYPVVIEFDVSSVWKGPDHQTMYLRTSLGVSTCGY